MEALFASVAPLEFAKRVSQGERFDVMSMRRRRDGVLS